jgi:protein ImuA
VALALAASALPLLWIRTEGGESRAGRAMAGGLAELGLPPAALMLVVTADEAALLRTAADAARCPGLGSILVESWGAAPGLDLTATRRLMLGAERSGVTIFSVRLAATPVPSAAASRWRVAAALSAPLAAGAPGGPAFEIECLRRRGGPAGQCERVEWNRDARCFVPGGAPSDRAGAPGSGDAAPLSGAGVSVAVDRAFAQRPAASVRRAG